MTVNLYGELNMKKNIFSEFSTNLILVLLIMMVFLDIPYMEYLIIGVADTFEIVYLTKKKLTNIEFKILFLFFLYITIQIIGLFFYFSILSLRTIGSSVLICLFILYCMNYLKIENTKTTKLICFWGILSLSAYMIFGKISTITGNTKAGEILFLSFLLQYIILYISQSGKQMKFKWHLVFLLIINILTLLIIYKDSSRTAFFTSMFIIITYFLFKLTNPSKDTMKKIFVVFCILIVLITIFYINIHMFSWYENLNAISVKYFDKNIDSNRAYIWRETLKNLKGHWILGLGTGKLPDIYRYAASSFHNTYLQILTQNGLFGLSIVVYLFYILWINTIDKSENILVKYGSAVFLGIILYNCFEVTLLSNKISIGIIEWLIIGISLGVNLRNKNKLNWR